MHFKLFLKHKHLIICALKNIVLLKDDQCGGNKNATLHDETQEPQPLMTSEDLLAYN